MTLTPQHHQALREARRAHLARRITTFLACFVAVKAKDTMDLRSLAERAITLSEPWPSALEEEQARLAHLLLCAVLSFGEAGVPLAQRTLAQHRDLVDGLGSLEQLLRQAGADLRLETP